MMEKRELFFEHEIDAEVFDSAFTEMLLGPKYREDACWKGSKAASGAYQAIIAAMPPHDVTSRRI
jgi:hypothetical protein